ncbi:MAG: hypothetical protein NTV57_05950 [Cyanobacteria bacterium]|nr:hypothetical protein [Cyanobacteriota bacterium]
MQFHKSLIHFGIVGTSIVLASLPVQAAVIMYTDRAAFLAALSSSSTDNYEDLNGFYTSPLSRTISGYIYDAAATGGLYTGNAGGSQVLSSNNSVALTLNFTNGAPTAVGGYFFNTDFNFNIVNGAITVTANPGASVQSVVTSSATNFFGWLDDSGTPFTSLVIVPATGGSTAYPAVDDLVLYPFRGRDARRERWPHLSP